MRPVPPLPFILLLLTVSLHAQTTNQTNKISTVTLFSQEQTTAPGKEKDVIILEHADNVEYFKVENIGEDIVKIRGRATISYKKNRLRADAISINLKTRKIYGWGDVYLIDGSKTIIGDSFFFDMRKEKGAVYQASTVIDGLLYSGATIKNLDEDFFKIEDGFFSTCTYRQPHYYLGVNKIWLYPDNSFLILHLRYLVGGTTLFYFPFAFRTQKGTGITTYAGYSSQKGFFMQNTYSFSLFRKILGLQLRGDYYQFGGAYGGTTIKLPKTDLSLNMAISRTLQTNGKTLNTFRWMNTLNVNASFSKPARTLTQIQAYYFNSSDTLFYSDYMVRSYRGGLSLDSLNLLQTSSPYYNPSFYNQNAYYVTFSDSRGPSFLSAAVRANVLWNNNLNKMMISSLNLPDASWRFSGTISPFTEKSNQNQRDKILRFLFNGYGWSAYTTTRYLLYLDQAAESISKKELTWNTYASLSKSFLFWKLLSYSPSVRFGNILQTGDGLSEAEKLNFKNASYMYVAYQESLRLNFHNIPRKKIPLTSTLDISRNLQSRLTGSSGSVYGKTVSHSANASYYFGFRTFSYSASISANLLARTNMRLDLSDKSIYNNLSQSASWRAFNRITLNDSFQYSIKESRPVRNTLNISWSYPAFAAKTFKVDSLAANAVFDYNFLNPLQSSIHANWGISFQPFRYTSFNLSGSSRNRNLYVYSKKLLDQYGYAQTLYRNIGQDLLDSFAFFDLKKRKNSMFKMQSVSLYMKRNLHCWEMSAGYTLYQKYTTVPYYNNVGYPYWEHRLWVQINLVDYESLRYRKEEISPPPVFEND